MKTGLTPAESMVVNGGERSNAALAGTIETESSQVGAMLTGSAMGRIIQKGGARPLPFGREGCRGEIETPLPFSWGFKGAILARERMAPLPAHPCGTQGIPVPQRDKTFLATGPATPPAALPTVITSRYKTARPLHAPPIVK